MKTRLSIKNFRVFDENGVTFELNPITILTGSNSSGKSSVVKAICLLNSFLRQIKKAVDNGEKIELDKYKLDFNQYPINLLGRFDKVIHDGSETNSVTIEYTTYSLMLSKDVAVQFVFSADGNDELNNAFLKSVSMSTDDGIFFFSGKEETFCNLNIIKEDYISFLIGQFFTHACIRNEFDNEIGALTDEQYILESKQAKEYLRSLDSKRRIDIFKYVRTAKCEKTFVHDVAECQVLQQISHSESIFNIPLLGYLLEYKKNEVVNYIFDVLVPEDSQSLYYASKKVLDAFMQSDFSTFDKFFSAFELNHFEHTVCSSGSFPVPHMLSARELSFKQDYITSSPHNMQVVWSFGEDGKLIEKGESEKQADIEKWENRAISFEMLYEVVMEWNHRFEEKHNDSHNIMIHPSDKEYAIKPYNYTESSILAPNGSVNHLAYELLTMFAEAVALEVATPEWAGNMCYVSSTRANVNRLYNLDNKDDFTQLLQNYFDKKRLYREYKNVNSFIGKREYEEDDFMNRWIEKFEVGKAISLHIDNEGLGVQIRLHNKKGDTGRLLADEGYGITQLVSILLQIETAILAAQGEKVNYYGSIAWLDSYDFNKFQYEIYTIAVEEPEIHLHPKYQSLLADMFVEAYEKYNIHFLIETHSEYLIRKAQVFVARSNYENEEAMSKENPFKVYYIPRGENPYEMTFCADGRFKNEFGKGFFDEATNLAFEIL